MVEWRKLISVAEVLYGYPFESSFFSENENFIPLIRIRDVKPGIPSTYYTGNYTSEYIIHKGDILVGMDGEFNLGKWNGREGLLNQRVLKLKSKDGYSIDGYLFHYMGPVFKKIEKETAGGSVKHLSAKVINNIQIPLPSLQEQERIVGILDTFTASIDNLKEQITQRRKQYEHYRDQLLDLEGKPGVEMKKLGEVIITLKTGLNPRKNFVLNSPGSYLPYITGKDIYNNKINITEKTDKIDEIALKLINKRACLEKGLILFASTGTGTVGRMAIIEEYNYDWGMSETLYALKIKNDIYSKYVMYCLYSNSIKKQYEPKISKGSVPHLKVIDLINVLLPIPSIQKQQRIVSILDTFEASIANLEAQLAERQKQYEYYRNKLLTFE